MPWLILLCLWPVLANAIDNRLQDHASPYLAMHGEDPVHWQDWNQQTLELAQKQGKLLLISSGYFTCHWCHVMQKESYQDAEVAAFLNEHFIPVKLDRELNPALDAYLIDFLERTQGRAGWPLNIFVTPEGFPLFGLTYAPRDEFLAVLKRLHRVWGKRHAEMGELARKAVLALNAADGGLQVKPDYEKLKEELVQAALRLADELSGGFGHESKFPMPAQLLILLDRVKQQPNSVVADFLRTTLDAMASEGLRDHLAGGFFRYAVDPGWQIPHFEKMLYTQALLIRVYLLGADVLQEPRYLDVARDTLAFVKTHLRDPNTPLFIAALSAVDEQGREGGSYLLSEPVLKATLSPEELTLAHRVWRFEANPDLALGWLPRQGRRLSEIAEESALAEADLAEQIGQIRQKLLAARAQRPPPRDEKILAGWNGLMLTALVEAARALTQTECEHLAWLMVQELLADFWDGEKLVRALDAKGAVGQASLEDYAYVAQGLLAWSQFKQDEATQEQALEILDQAWRRFFRSNRWQLNDQAVLPGIPGEPVIADGAMPSPAAVIIELSLRYGSDFAKVQARLARELGQTQMHQAPLWYASQIGVKMPEVSNTQLESAAKDQSRSLP